MMRVLFVAGRFPPDVQTGFSVAFARLVAEARRHAQVRLVAGVRGAPGGLPEGTMPVRVTERRSARWLALWRATRAAIAQERPDVVVVAGVGLAPVGCPVVAVVPDRSRRGWGQGSSVSMAARMAAAVPRAVVVPTEAMRSQVAGLGIRHGRVHRLPMGVDRPERPPPLPPRKSRLEVVHPGTIHPAKGQHISVDAVCRLPPPLRSQVRLTLAGAVHDERYLEQIRGAADGHPVVIRPGAGLRQVMLGSHAVVLPVAAQLGFPDQAAHALAVGRPVVWSDVGAMVEVMHGQGIRVPGNDVPAVRDALVHLLTADLESLGTRAWTQAESNTWVQLWPQWAAVLTRAARRARLPTTP